MTAGRERQGLFNKCAYGDMAKQPHALSTRALTEPLNCAILSPCPVRQSCQERVQALLDALEVNDMPTVKRLFKKDL